MFIFAPLVAARSERKLSLSALLSKNADNRFDFFEDTSSCDASASLLLESVGNSERASASSSLAPENPRYLIRLCLGLFEVRVSITFQSAFSVSRVAAAILDSQMLSKFFCFKAFSNASVDVPTPASIAKVDILNFDDRLCGGLEGISDLVKLITLPPNPKDAPQGLSNHLGALVKLKLAPCGCDWALLKKSSSLTVCIWLPEIGWASGFEFWIVCIPILPSKDAVARRFGL